MVGLSECWHSVENGGWRERGKESGKEGEIKGVREGGREERCQGRREREKVSGKEGERKRGCGKREGHERGRRKIMREVKGWGKGSI